MQICVVGQARTKVVFFGDSITEVGAKAGGYISKLQADDKLSARFEFIGAGIRGNKVYDLYMRIDTDVLARKPDVVVIYIGINDIWHKRTHGTGTEIDKFAKFYEAIVAKLKEARIVPVICTPSVLGERTGNVNEQDGDLNLYSEWIRSFAKKNDLPLVDLRKVFVEYDAANNPENKVSGILTTDRVHLNDIGNGLVAAEMKKVLIGLPPRSL
jgi:lysophospholipase L1-like esterase